MVRLDILTRIDSCVLNSVVSIPGCKEYELAT